jgi:hypothetical protein
MANRGPRPEVSGRGCWALLAFIAAALVLGVVAVVTVRRPPGLPQSPGIEGEDFGCGIALGMEAEAVQAALGQLPPGVSGALLTREELAGRDPYSEATPGKDLLIVIPGQEEGSAQTVAIALKAYLSDPATSKLQLQGRRAAELIPDTMRELYGMPRSTSTGSDGATHLTYHFAGTLEPGRVYELVTSHGSDGACYAISLSLMHGNRR